MKRRVKVGIPRALSYYSFYPLWRVFLEKLGAEVIVSRSTNRKILEDGIKETVSDACIPIKVFQGHVMDLIDKVDYVFVPRLVSADGKATFCPKFLGLPDMVRYSGVNLPGLIDVRYNLSKVPGGLLRFFRSVALAIGVKNPFKQAYAAINAVLKQKKYDKLLQAGVRPGEAFELISGNLDHNRGKQITAMKNKPKNPKATVALLGYPYTLHDPFISAGLYIKLSRMGVEIVTYEQIPLKVMRRYSKVLPQNFFWYYSNQVCWAGLYLLKQNLIDGIIHVTAFGCGPDAMVDKTLELEAKSTGVPFLSLSIDEHTGEGGVQTRLEAFVDMLWAKREKIRAG